MTTHQSPAATVTAQIAEARRLLKPTPVESSHVPNWLRLRLLKAFGNPYRYSDGHSVLFHAVNGNHDWLDHWGSTTLRDGRRAFVSEPYHVTQQDVQQIATLAEAIGCRWWLSANSWWYPGQTIRIVIAEPTP